MYADEASGLRNVVTSLSRLYRRQPLVKEIPCYDPAGKTPECVTVRVLLDHALYIGCNWVSELKDYQHTLHRLIIVQNYKSYGYFLFIFIIYICQKLFVIISYCYYYGAV